MTDLSRRGFFALAATVVTAACGSSGTAKPADSSADPGSSAAQTTAAASVEPTEAPTTEAPTTAAPTTVPPPSTVALDADPFVLGVTSGDPAADGFVLWTRLVGPADDVTVRYELSMDEGFAELAAFGDTITSSAVGHSVHMTVVGLAPDTWYWYRFQAGGFTSPAGRARTTPAAGATPNAPLRLATASCQDYQDGFYAAHRDIAEHAPDVLAFLGDFIYEEAFLGADNPAYVRHHDTPEPKTLDDYRARYAQYLSDPQLRASRAVCPWMVIWDDHEVENNYAGLVPQDPAEAATFAERRAAAYQAWWEHMPVRLPQPDGTADYQMYRTIDWGGLIRFVLLDGRQYRSDQACGDVALSLDPACPETFDAARTMLGDTQEQWLYDQLDSSGAVWNAITQQVILSDAMVNGAVLNYDMWDGYPAERARILQHLADHDTRNPVVLTGDIHFAGVADLRAPGGPDAPLVGVEFVTSSISSAGLIDDSLTPVVETLNDIIAVELAHRGWTLHTVDPAGWTAEIRIVTDVKNPDSTVVPWRSYAVADGVHEVRPL